MVPYYDHKYEDFKFYTFYILYYSLLGILLYSINCHFKLGCFIYIDAKKYFYLRTLNKLFMRKIITVLTYTLHLMSYTARIKYTNRIFVNCTPFYMPQREYVCRELAEFSEKDPDKLCIDENEQSHYYDALLNDSRYISYSENMKAYINLISMNYVKKSQLTFLVAFNQFEEEEGREIKGNKRTRNNIKHSQMKIKKRKIDKLKKIKDKKSIVLKTSCMTILNDTPVNIKIKNEAVVCNNSNVTLNTAGNLSNVNVYSKYTKSDHFDDELDNQTKQ